MSATNALNKQAIPQEHMDAVAQMDISMFSVGDVVNMILQRAQVIFDVPKGGKLIRAWTEGNEEPLLAVAQDRPDLLMRRTLAAIHMEYREMLPTLKQIGPKRIADIGCGYGFFDVFAAQELGCEIVLIDIEETENRHFGFKKSGAAYSNLAVAKAFALANGVAEASVTTINPDKEDLDDVPDVDLAMSFMSCGFHYPVTTYMDYFHDGVAARGHLILDLRAPRADPQIAELSELGQVETLVERDALKCVLVKKGE
ncbi:MAG: class I SAM-dependent methyltransferase [Pseudomonadota bacterium]